MRYDLEDLNSITLTEDEFGSEDKLYNALGNLLKILFRAGYKTEVYDDERNIIVIKFSHGNPEYEDPVCTWLTPDEYDEVMWNRENKKDEENEKDIDN